MTATDHDRRPGGRWAGGAARWVIVPLLSLGALGVMSAASALWGAQAPVSSAQVTSGTFGLSATWSSAPNLTGILPGQSRDGVLTLQHSGDGTWRYRVASSHTGTLRPTLTETFYAGATCTGTPVASGALSAATLPRGGSAQVCVRYTLPANAPSGLQGATSQITLTASAENRPS
ncbi:hypothetical protein [Oerskovia flava]|uniref:hypothetical protein n=1 Tax=Oerskovia flava TaxID=2986422 RepID=UPI00224001E8|nr:hypothetical protein [Oerskovia sp. JB1-3-2]